MSQITPNLALKVLQHFDRAINTALSQRVRNRTTFKGHLNTYRFCDNVWTFVLDDVEFKDAMIENTNIDRLKIVACDAKSSQGIFFVHN